MFIFILSSAKNVWFCRWRLRPSKRSSEFRSATDLEGFVDEWIESNSRDAPVGLRRWHRWHYVPLLGLLAETAESQENQESRNRLWHQQANAARWAKLRAEKLGWRTNDEFVIKWRESNAQELCFDENSFDAYTLAFTIRHCAYPQKVFNLFL